MDASPLDDGGPSDGATVGDGAIPADAGTCGACAAPTPVCDETSGSCVECVDTADCGPGLVCADHACVGCGDDADCPASLPECAAGSCVSCVGRTDCTPYQTVIEARSLVCGCLIREEAMLANIGFPGSIEAMYCSPFDATVRSTVLDLVFEPALNGSLSLDLARLARCDRADLLLEASTNFLLLGFPFPGSEAEVTGTGACVSGQECAEGTCSAPTTCPGRCETRLGMSCTSSADCGVRLDCNPTTSRCAALPGLDQPCDSWCQDGLWCDRSMQRCKVLPTAGQSCFVDGTCSPGLDCDVFGQCQPRELGAACGPDGVDHDLFCGPGFVCNGATCVAALAEGAACSARWECGEGLRCEGGACRPVRAPGAACTASDACAYGTECRAGRCSALPDLGEACTATCLRGVCASGTCAPAAAGASCPSPPSGVRAEALDECGDAADCILDASGAPRCQAPATTCTFSSPDGLCGPHRYCDGASCVGFLCP